MVLILWPYAPQPILYWHLRKAMADSWRHDKNIHALDRAGSPWWVPVNPHVELARDKLPVAPIEGLFPPLFSQRPPYDGAEVASWAVLAATTCQLQALGVFEEEEAIILNIAYREGLAILASSLHDDAGRTYQRC